MSTPEPPPARRFPFLPRPRSIAGQIVLLVLAAIVVAHGVATVAIVALREPWRPDGHPGVAANRIAVIARMVDATAPEARGALLETAENSLPSLKIAPWDGAVPTSAGGEDLRDLPLIGRLRDGFGRDLSVVDLSPKGARTGETEPLDLGITTPHGARFRATLPDDQFGPPKRNAIITTLMFLALSLAVLSIWATRALTAPLAKLAAAAEAFGTRREPAPLPTQGPAEVLAVASALDRMRARVMRLLDDRNHMLAAISHDLRTPITRLRLRAEFIDDDQARERTLRDLDQMNALVEAALAYARDERGADAPAERERPLIDLASLVQTVCDGFTDMGADVRLEQVRHVLVRADPEDLQRAIGNLVDNAIKYAGAARLSMSRKDDRIAIEVADDGPGIPEAERHAMLQPFVRGDRARNLNEASGFGLGLSIVLAIVEAHEGRLTLANRPGGGLTARVDLPLAAGRVVPPLPERLAAE